MKRLALIFLLLNGTANAQQAVDVNAIAMEIGQLHIQVLILQQQLAAAKAQCPAKPEPKK
jgi:hypothetical protein